MKKAVEPTDNEYSFLGAISTIVLVEIIGKFINYNPKLPDLVDVFLLSFIGIRCIYIIIKLSDWNEWKKHQRSEEPSNLSEKGTV